MSTHPIHATIPGHGVYTCTPLALDLAIMRHLPASPATLRRTLSERTASDWSSTMTVGECLIVLADLDGEA